MCTTPPSGGSSPPRMWSNVDLPQPLGPISATNSPLCTRSDTPRNTSRGGRLTRYVLWSDSATTTSASTPAGDVAAATWVRAILLMDEECFEDGRDGAGEQR